MRDKRILYIVLTSAAVVGVALFVWLYSSFDPANAGWFPRCPVKTLTGYDCPGCGSQRALHALFNGDLSAAWGANPMVLILTPIAAIYFFAAMIRPTSRLAPLHRALFSPYAILALAAAVVVWTIARNL
ncbi:MAG: DUF2752 domain-containing protein [Muribaculaceae bacterium]|nr:DUF2752 domain-containing protein [Muribaculaceae bacterium]